MLKHMKALGTSTPSSRHPHVRCNTKTLYLVYLYKHVKAEGRFKGDFLIERTSLIPLGLNKHRLNTCNYAIYKSRISRDRVLLISDRYYPWSSEIKTFYIDLLNKWRHCSLTKIVTCHSAKEYIRLNYLEKKISKSWGRFCWVS